jgi:hypothetical protein
MLKRTESRGRRRRAGTAEAAFLADDLKRIEQSEIAFLQTEGLPAEWQAVEKIVRDHQRPILREGPRLVLAMLTLRRIDDLRTRLTLHDGVGVAIAALHVGSFAGGSLVKHRALAQAEAARTQARAKARQARAAKERSVWREWQQIADALKNRTQSKAWAVQRIRDELQKRGRAAIPATKTVYKRISYP